MDNKIKEILKITLDKFIKENTSKDDNSIYKVTDKEEMSKYVNDVWNILDLSYKDVGGFKSARNPKDLLRTTNLMKLVIIDGEIVACATYRELGGFKMHGIGCNQTDIGKHWVKEIIKDDISNFKGWYWAEVSDAIEYFFKKFNGYPIPNIYVEQLLGKEVKLLDDGAHYIRKIGIDGTEYKKIIYGFRDKELYDKVMAEIENYADFMKKINQLGESFIRYPQNINNAIYIIENIYNLHYEDGFNELLPQWYDLLQKSLNELQGCGIADGTIKQYIETCEHLLQEMPVLELCVVS